eukprot:bmy_17635T0
MSGKEKSKSDEMAKADKVRYDREMKDYGPAKGGKKKKDPNAPKRPPSGFFLSVPNSAPRSNLQTLASLLEMWQRSWARCAAKLKEKYEKDVADCKSKGKFDGAKGPAKVARKKVEEEGEGEWEGEEEEEEEDE